MDTQKVCLVTGAAGLIGQRVLLSLVNENKKILALGEPDDVFSPSVLQNNHIRINTALPVTAQSFKKHEVQFCFGDLSDISFIASIFSSASNNNVEIEYVIHLSANKDIQKTSPKAYHPDFGDTVNLLEVARAYWQSNPDVFKGFFFASDKNNAVNSKIEKMMQSLTDKYNFPTDIYTPQNQKIGAGYTGSTSILSLYRLITPFGYKSNTATETSNISKESKYTSSLIGAIKHFIGA